MKILSQLGATIRNLLGKKHAESDLDAEVRWMQPTP